MLAREKNTYLARPGHRSSPRQHGRVLPQPAPRAGQLAPFSPNVHFPPKPVKLAEATPAQASQTCMDKFLTGSTKRGHYEFERFRPTPAQTFLYDRRNCSDGIITRDLRAQVINSYALMA